jgi:hypothetical protein
MASRARTARQTGDADRRLQPAGGGAMSLVPTWVLAQDGNYYSNPIVIGVEPDGAHARWYICFDHEEPPELVIETKYRRITFNRIHDILDPLGFRYRVLSLHPRMSLRCFDPTADRPSMVNAGAISLRIDDPIPVPQRFHAVAGLADATGVIYQFDRR